MNQFTRYKEVSVSLVSDPLALERTGVLDCWSPVFWKVLWTAWAWSIKRWKRDIQLCWKIDPNWILLWIEKERRYPWFGYAKSVATAQIQLLCQLHWNDEMRLSTSPHTWLQEEEASFCKRWVPSCQLLRRNHREEYVGSGKSRAWSADLQTDYIFTGCKALLAGKDGLDTDRDVAYSPCTSCPSWGPPE